MVVPEEAWLLANTCLLPAQERLLQRIRWGIVRHVEEVCLWSLDPDIDMEVELSTIIDGRSTIPPTTFDCGRLWIVGV